VDVPFGMSTFAKHADKGAGGAFSVFSGVYIPQQV
jgi:hypothetical protein